MTMPNFMTYEVEYTNVKPWNNMNIGSGKINVSLVEGTKSIRGKLKKAVEQKISSLGVHVVSFKELQVKA